MSDFMQWLYAHYIRPQLDAAPPDGYELPLSLLEGEFTAEMAALTVRGAYPLDSRAARHSARVVRVTRFFSGRNS